MTSRERLHAALSHTEADQVPLDLASTQVTGISCKAYSNLRAFLDLSEEEPAVCDRIQQICIPHDDIMSRFGVDTRGLWPMTSHNRFEDEDAGGHLRHTDEWGLGYRFHQTDSLWYDLFQSPMTGPSVSVEQIENYDWPKGAEPERFEGLADQARTFQQQGYPVVLKSICAGLMEMGIRLRGMEDFLIDLMIDKKRARALIEKLLEIKIQYWDKAIDLLSDRLDVVAEGDDFGTQTSQFISLQTFREMFRPAQRELIEFLKKKAPNTAVFFHSCGNIREFIPDFIEMGIDIINPVHITAAGMEPRALKTDFGKDVVFWGGGIDTQETLPHGSIAGVQDEVKRILDIMAPGGGYVFNTIHNIQADVPPENIVAMYDTLKEYGVY